MVSNDIKQNINKIDSDLKNLFENVYITEKAGKGIYYVEISANKMFLFEGCKKRVELKAYISMDDLKSNIIKWNYSLNPLNESADRIEKVSYAHSVAKDMYDIVSNKRMVKEYFDALEAHVDLILENNEFPGATCWFDNSTPEYNEYKQRIFDIYSKISNIVKKQVPCKEGFSNISSENSGFINFIPENKMTMVDKFNLEKELLSYEKVSYVSFGSNDTIKVTIK
jgi:hypothetical protein